MTYSATRTDVKQLASTIENLAKELQAKLDKGEDFITVCNELVRNATTMTFTIGEVYALEQTKTKKKVTGTVRVPGQYHNVRDSLGRFKRVV
jgi:anti-sigma regulatory factor (Ser/Thr protein kinase)